MNIKMPNFWHWCLKVVGGILRSRIKKADNAPFIYKIPASSPAAIYIPNSSH